MCASFSRQQSRLPSFGAQKIIFHRFALKSGLDKPLKSLSVSGYSFNGAKRIRTADPLHAMQVLYQLSYGPMNNSKARKPVRCRGEAYTAKELKPGATPPLICLEPAPAPLATQWGRKQDLPLPSAPHFHQDENA